MTQQEKEIKETTLGELSYNGTQVVRQGESTIPAFERTCFKCGTEFIYISEAIKHDRDGDYVVCPTCGAFIAHQENPKIADFIPPKCTSDAKCEDRSQKHSDSPTTLEEAAENYIAPIENDEGLDYINFNGRDIKDAFIAGANWQKEQMLKDAVEVDVADLNGDIYNYCIEEGLTDEDKVKIVIVKEEMK